MSMKVILLFVAVAFAFLAFAVMFFVRTPPPVAATAQAVGSAVKVVKVHPVDPSAIAQHPPKQTEACVPYTDDDFRHEYRGLRA
jgi:hypothetical protein